MSGLHELNNLQLHSFAAYFEIMGALNLGFVGFKKFRESINEQLLDANSAFSKNAKLKIEKKFKNCQEKNGQLSSLANEMGIENDITIISPSETTNSIIFEYESRLKTLDGEFKPIFFISGIYCIYLLIVEGYSQFYSINPHVICNSLSYIPVLYIVIGIIFFKSFTRLHNRPIQFIYVLSFLLLFFFFRLYNTINSPDFSHFQISDIKDGVNIKGEERYIITYAVVLALLPYSLYTFRYYFEKKIAPIINYYKYIASLFFLEYMILFKQDIIIRRTMTQPIKDLLDVKVLKSISDTSKLIKYRVYVLLYNFFKIKLRSESESGEDKNEI